jgi:hypothetical protein
VALFTSAIGGFIVGIEAQQVMAVEDGDWTASPEPAVDLATCWGVRSPVPARWRLMLRLPGQRRLLVGPRGAVRLLPRSGLLAVPGFLDGLSEGQAIGGFFQVERGVGCLLDIERLPPAGLLEQGR